ncbi:hypothetical protein K3495_g6642 [Podosphaera aphanis]|nr:hypothetical protein K3495_g6642 [Podosphaera aphanis]
MATQVQRFKSWILAGSVAATTVMGALYGAGLKSQHQINKETDRNLRAAPSPAEVLAVLEERRSSLIYKQTTIEKKIDEIKIKSANADSTNSGKVTRL